MDMNIANFNDVFQVVEIWNNSARWNDDNQHRFNGGDNLVFLLVTFDTPSL